MNPVSNCMVIEIPCTNATATQFQMPDVPYLRGKKITAIVGSSASNCLASGNLNLTQIVQNQQNANFTSVFLTFSNNKGFQFIQNLPLIELCPESIQTVAGITHVLFANNTNGMMEINPTIIDFTKSYVYIPAGIGASNYSLQLTIFFEN
jgi:hypothetical protein